MQNQDVTFLLANESIGKLLVRYSLPAIAAMVVFSLYNIIDSIFIGHGVGAMAISGLAITFPVMNLTFALGLLVGIGGASIASIRMGQKDMDSAIQVLGNVVLLGLINGVGFGVLAILFLDPILICFGASDQTLPYAREFMQIILLGLPITYTMFNLNHLMRASGYPQKAMFSALITVGVNCILAPICIFWLGWGIRGAAFATVLSQFSGMIWVVHHFRNPANSIHFKPGILRLQKKIVTSIFSIGMSPFLMNVCACAVAAIINIALREQSGDMAVGAFGIINRVLIVFVMIVMGLAQGMQPIVGYNYGAQQISRVRKTFFYGLAIGIAVTSLGTLASQLAPNAIARMFTTDQNLIDLATSGLRICTFLFPLVGGQMVIGNFFQSIGKAKLSIFLSLTRQLLFLVPALLILPHFFGLEGIWISLPVADALATFTSVALLIHFYRKQLRHAGPHPKL